ncbi:hypothetical protein Tco_0859651 [Tanacetum coccineum]|uniref:Uncharacterized protein n=1 Tax=Tanacetum coccineum TaxID=301880 RepID=A0ABQ5BIA1_9ASTR
MRIQEMEDLNHHYLDEMQSISNQIHIKDYRNKRLDIHFRRECEITIDKLKGKFNGMSIKINKKKELRQLEQAANLSTYITEPSRHFNSFYDDDDYEESIIPLNEIISQIPPSIAITHVLLTMEPEDSHIMGNEDLSTIPKKESDEFLKSSVEDLVPILSESEDTSESDSDCDLPSIDVPQGKFVTFSNPLFDSNDDFTSSDDESLSDEDISVASILEGFTDEPPLVENDDLFDLESKENEWKKILYDAPIIDLMTEGQREFTLKPLYHSLRKLFLLSLCSLPL